MTKPADSGQIAKAREIREKAREWCRVRGLRFHESIASFAISERQAVIEECVKAAKPAAESITKMVDIWLEKMNLPTSNKEGKQIFTQTLQDVIELAIRSMGE